MTVGFLCNIASNTDSLSRMVVVSNTSPYFQQDNSQNDK